MGGDGDANTIISPNTSFGDIIRRYNIYKNWGDTESVIKNAVLVFV